MSDEHAHGDIKFLFGLFIGGIVGAFIIFFLGTKEGKKTSKFLEEKGRDLVDDIGDKVSELEEKSEELVEQGEVIKENVVAEVEEKKEELTQATSEKLDTALAHIEKIQTESAQTTAELRTRLFKNIPRKR
jgi:gas vesicle protein